ncbi:MAG: GvpL/GvpF family gas vesicle protein [Proteobacteria bacterium]|nr:GvpL/GvpF family gas vesicle protein [Pseudomonadota bacterium]
MTRTCEFPETGARNETAGKSSNRDGIYLYAIVDNKGWCTDRDIGIDGAQVYPISNGRVAAMVSKVSYERIRPERRHLSAHQQVLNWLMKVTTPLPVRFGIIADGPKAIQNILSHNQETILDQLGRVAHRAEMGLIVTWDVPNIFEYFIDTCSELRTARDRIFVNRREPTQEEKIEIGQMFDLLHNEYRAVYTEKVEEILSPYCFEIKTTKCRGDQEVMNLACLVDRDSEKMSEFEKGIYKAAKLFDDNYSFSCKGPWVPHNFTDINVEL